MNEGLDEVAIELSGLGDDVWLVGFGVVLGVCLVVVEVCFVVLGRGASTSAPQFHVPYTTPSPLGAMYLNRPRERSRAPGGHPMHLSGEMKLSEN